MNRKRVFLAFAGVLLLVAIFTTIATYLLNKPSNRLIAQWEQAASVGYGSSTPFRLIVIERNTDWSDFPYTERTYHIYLGNEFPYGYWYRLPFHYHQLETESEIKKSAVEWSDEGVSYKTKSGEVLFIPKSVFAARRP